ncbi:hypothetical protein [Saccharothrix sp.]|uniref:hypothetical protein n=1 Tax=Saccharothrix sp. TaxID=1873460 RepID=UPI002810A33A|nr:hypothetical protein [Saccharothrix sp.]
MQVAAADALLHEEPLGTRRLFQDVDPTAAAVAAAHWLQAAANVAAEVSGGDPTEVVMEADDIEALPVETPTLVLERLNAGESPREVVLDLIDEAMAVAEGRLPDPSALLERIEEADDLAERYGADQELREQLMPIRITALDPRRPAHDLLEDLLSGIHGCQLVHSSYADLDEDDDFDEDDDLDQDDDTDEAVDRRSEALHEMFTAAVRAKAAGAKDRLL